MDDKVTKLNMDLVEDILLECDKDELVEFILNYMDKKKLKKLLNGVI